MNNDADNYNEALSAALTNGDLEAMTVLIAGRGYPWYWGTPIPTVMDSIDPETLACSEPSLLVEGVMSLGAHGVTSGRWGVEHAVEIYERARDIADRIGTRRDQGFVRYYLGYLARSQGDSTTARSWMEEAHARFGDKPIERFYTHYELGWIEVTEGDAAAARAHFQPALASLEADPGWVIQVVHLRAGLALTEAIAGNAALGLALVRQAVEEARTVALPGVLVMTLVRAAEVAALAGIPAGAELGEVLRLLRDQGSRRWVASALTVAAIRHEGQGRHEVAARLLGGAAGVAAALEEDPVPLPAIAALVAATRRHLVEALGSEALAAEEAAGRITPVPALLGLALDGLDGFKLSS